jgi:predicted DNA-binding transcriptional regulator YafY
MRLNNIEEVEGWLLSFGTNATVVRPRVLRERLAKVGEEFVRRYGRGPCQL